jgi:hypothetical protein
MMRTACRSGRKFGLSKIGIGKSSKEQAYNLFSYSCCSGVFYSVFLIGRYCLL